MDAVVAALGRASHLTLEDGLSAVELELAEQQFAVRFPPLWRAVLGVVHPVALPVPPRGADGVLRWTAVPDWRGRDLQATSELVEAPITGVLFDVVENDFWWPAWGRRPRRRAERQALARDHLSQAPRLVPLWGHLYVSDNDRSPVLSVVQSDLYCPAGSVVGLVCGEDTPGDTHQIEFWSDLLDWSQGG